MKCCNEIQKLLVTTEKPVSGYFVNNFSTKQYIVILGSKDVELQLDVELTTDIPVKKLNSKCVSFLFGFAWLKSLVTKQKLVNL